ncbi:hypothetical protein ACWU4D_18030 [Vibrio sp. WJH972]
MIKFDLDPNTVSFDWLKEQANRKKTNLRNDYIRTAEIWAPLVGVENFHVFNYSDIKDHPTQLLNSILGILGEEGVDDWNAYFDVRIKHNEGLTVPMPEEFEIWLRENIGFSFESQISQLKKMGVYRS